MDIKNLFDWLEENKGSICMLSISKEAESSTIARTYFDDYKTDGDLNNPMIMFKECEVTVLVTFMSDFKGFLTGDKDLRLYIE